MELDYADGDDTQPVDFEVQRLERLRAFAASLHQRRKEAINAREQSGIEQQWLADEEYYNGVDDHNRGQYLLKPSTKQGRVTQKQKSTGSTRSTAFVNITQPYVDLVSAREFDMLFPVDDKPFGFEPTPVPDIDRLVDSQSPMPDGDMTQGEAAKQYLQEAKDKAEKAETQVWDWLVEANWHTEGRKVIQQKNLIGTGVLKGPFPNRTRKRKLAKDGQTGTIVLEAIENVQPSSKWIDAWNIYPDPSCGNNIHNGNYIWEKDKISGKQLRELKGQPGYLDGEIDGVLEEGPNNKYLTDDYRRNRNTWFQEQDFYEIWYYHGYATADELSGAGCGCQGDGMDVCVIMVNERVIKASRATLDSGEFPYDVFVYQQRQDYWAGIGVARQVRVAQDVVNAATRAMLDNAGISAGPQVIFRSGIVRPADSVYEITPHKLWLVDEDATIDDVRNAFMSVAIPNNQQHMEAIIRLALEFAERATSMPLLLQGQQGAATDTVGGMQILQANSNTVLRRTAKLFDDVVERHISRYYDWLMQYGDDDTMKGDFKVIVKGTSALYERDAQNQAILQLAQFSQNPQFMLNPERLMVEILKSNKISPNRVMMTDEEKKKLQAQPPPEEPAIQVAKLKADADLKREQLKAQSDMAEIEAKGDTMESEFALKVHMADAERDHEAAMKKMDMDLAVLKLAQSSQQSIDSIKAQLAQTAQKLNVQKELTYAAQGHDHDMADKGHGHTASLELLKPPTEPGGLAQAGHSYEQ